MDAFAAYSGGLESTPGGIFPVNDKIIEDCTFRKINGASCNLRSTDYPQILQTKFQKPAYLVNPPDVDEFEAVARLTGIKGNLP